MTSTVTTRPSADPLPTRRRARAVDHAWLVGAAMAIGAAVTVGMWIRHGQLEGVHGPGGVATAAGQLAALAGTYVLLVEILLMSRISWLERAIGLDRLAVWHRWTGFALLWLLTGHVVFTTIGWAGGSIPPTNVVHETRWLISHEPDVLVAWVGFVLLVLVAAVSVRAARRKLQRETWYFIHLYVYLAVALSFAHQLAVGSDFDNDPAARVWWVALYVVVFGAILWWRVLVPLSFNVRHGFRLERVVHETPDVVSIVVSGRGLGAITVQPGQFFMWRRLTRSGWWQPHPFSLSAAPRLGRLRFTIKALGDGSRDWHHARPGTRLFAEGPYGTFTSDRRTSRLALLIAGGIGITPLRALLDTFGPDDDVVLLYRVVSEREVLFGEELRGFADESGMRIHVIPGAEIGDDRTDLLSVPALARGVPDIRTRDCFVCGPPGLIAAVSRRLRKLGVPAQQIHFERFEL